MYLIAAVDDRNGMLFNHRRQSQDRVLREKILELAGKSRLWMNGYSRKQFAPENISGIHTAEDFLAQAGEEDYCFVEDQAVSPFKERIKELYLFKWNRKYPGDFFFDLDVTEGCWKLIRTEEFVGSSHEKIILEVYRHEN